MEDSADEMEMTMEELQKFIRDSVNHRLLLTPELMSKHKLLLMLWDRKEKLYTDLYKLFECSPTKSTLPVSHPTRSVSKCEAIVRQVYAKLGWEYKALDTEDCIGTASICGGTQEETEGCASPGSSGITAACSYEKQTEIMTGDKCEHPILTKELKVALKRLPMDLRPQRSTPPKTSKVLLSDDEISNADSDYQPSAPSSDSDLDFSVWSGKSDRHKKKKLRKTEKCAKVTPVPQEATTSAQPSTSAQPVNINKTNANGFQEVKIETKPFAVTEAMKPANGLPDVPKEPHVGMHVLARRKRLRWESGIIAEIVEKENGTQKYKVTFEDKGKVLVSGHHLAFNGVPKLVHLTVGGRVVSKCKSEDTFFSPGILAELPSRKNHMRFLVFFDDHQALYVALPVIRIICKPLPNSLDDIRDEGHKAFMKDYLQRMPYPPQTQFRLGQSIRVKLDGVLETCTVLQLDSSLMEVVFTKDDHKEWLYRGSMRLEHIMSARENSNK